MSSIKLSSAAINKALLKYEHIYGVNPTGRASGESKLLEYLGDLVPGPWVSNLTGAFVATNDQRFEEYVMPASMGTSTSPNVVGGASVMIAQANPALGTMPCTINSVTGTNYGSTFTNVSDINAKNIRVSLPGATMAQVSEMSGAFDGAVDPISHRSVLFMRMFALLEAVAHGWNMAGIPGGVNNPLSGGDIFWCPNIPAQHQTWINRVLAARGSSVNPLTLIRHKNGVPLTPAIANAIHWACSPYCGVAVQMRAGGRPGVAGRVVDSITCAIYNTALVPVGNQAAPGMADIVQAIKYLLRCTGDVLGYNQGFEMWAKGVQFAGSELTILPTSLNTRFFNDGTAVFCRIWALIFRALYVRMSITPNANDWGRDAARFDIGNAELQGIIDRILALLQTMNAAVVRGSIETNLCWRGILNNAFFGGAQDVETWVWSYGGHSNVHLFETASETGMWVELGRVLGVGGGAFSWTNLFGLPVGQAAETAANAIPTRNNLNGDLNMPADGVYGQKTYPIASGIPEFLGSAESKQFKSVGTEGVSRIISSANANELLTRMYFPAVALRCASNQASHLQGNSRMAGSMSMGIVDTGNPGFDDLYSAFIATGSIMDTTELVTTHKDVCKGVLAWKDHSSSSELPNYSSTIWTNSARDRFIKEVAFHPFVDQLVLGVSSVVGGVINTQATTLTLYLQGLRGGLPTAPLSDEITRLDAVALSAWLMEVGGQSVMWRRKLQFFDSDNALIESGIFDVQRQCVRLPDGFYGLPRIDSVYHWYYSDGLDGIWIGGDHQETSPKISRNIYTAAGRYRGLYTDGTANVNRADFGGGTLQLRAQPGALSQYPGVFIGGGGSAAYRTSTPTFTPAANANVVDANGTIDDLSSLVTLPGKYTNCKSANRSLISGIRVPERPTSGFDVMQQMWKGLGVLSSKLSLFGLSPKSPAPPLARIDADAGDDATHTTKASTNTSTSKSGTTISTLTADSGGTGDSKMGDEAKAKAE